MANSYDEEIDRQYFKHIFIYLYLFDFDWLLF